MQLSFHARLIALFIRAMLLIFLLSGACLAADQAFLTVTSSPSGANVYLDDVFHGTTPCRITAGYGFYHLTVTKEGFPYHRELLDLSDHGRSGMRHVNFFASSSQKLGKLEIKTTPDNAKVYTNGQYRGKTPVLLSLETGTYNVRVEKNGYYPYQEELFIKKNRTTRLYPHLDKRELYGKAWIQSYPSGARIFIRNTYYDVTPARIELWSGKHRIRVEKDGYKPLEKIVEVPSKRQVRVSFKLEPLYTHGIVKITSNPTGCMLFVDGKYYSKTPVKLRLSNGRHTLRIESRGHISEVDTIDIQGGEKLKRYYQLKRPVVHRPSKGVLRVMSTPQSATVVVDGIKHGVTPMDIELVVGVHDVVISKKRHEAQSRSVRIDKGAVKEVWLELKRKDREGTYRFINISSNVDAKVMIDGIYRGKTPFSVSLQMGLHNIKLFKRGYQTHEEDLIIRKRGGDSERRYVLIKKVPLQLTGKVEIISKPLNAKIFIDNRYYGVTPLVVTLNPGHHTLELKHKGFDSYNQNISIYPGENNPMIRASMKRKGYYAPSRVQTRTDFEN